MRVFKVGDMVKVTHTNSIEKMSYIDGIYKIQDYGDDYEYIIDDKKFFDFELSSIKTVPLLKRLYLKLCFYIFGPK